MKLTIRTFLLLGILPAIIKPTIVKAQVKDIEGNIYKTCKIGDHELMAENLATGTFNNGDKIPEAKTKEQWVEAGKNKTAAWCYYDNDPTNGKKYGKLYNIYAFNDNRSIFPPGWKAIAHETWPDLKETLGDYQFWRKLKSVSGWKDEKGGGKPGTNETGFNFLPGGVRANDGYFKSLGIFSYLWRGRLEKYSQDETIGIGYNMDSWFLHSQKVPEDYPLGAYVRCERDLSTTIGTQQTFTSEQQALSFLKDEFAKKFIKTKVSTIDVKNKNQYSYNYEFTPDALIIYRHKVIGTTAEDITYKDNWFYLPLSEMKIVTTETEANSYNEAADLTLSNTSNKIKAGNGNAYNNNDKDTFSVKYIMFPFQFGNERNFFVSLKEAFAKMETREIDYHYYFSDMVDEIIAKNIQAQKTQIEGARSWNTILSLIGISITEAKEILRKEGLTKSDKENDKRLKVEAYSFYRTGVKEDDKIVEPAFTVICKKDKVEALQVNYFYLDHDIDDWLIKKVVTEDVAELQRLLEANDFVNQKVEVKDVILFHNINRKLSAAIYFDDTVKINFRWNLIIGEAKLVALAIKE